MPYYHQLKPRPNDSADTLVEKRRTIEKLQALRAYLKETVPPSMLNYNLLLATWNIREFDSPSYGDRISEAFYYISEILATFDLVAIQEVHRDLTGLRQVMSLLGDDWKYVISDTTEGDKGNDERIAYVYNARKVQFGGLAGELTLPSKKERVPDPDRPGKMKTRYIPVEQIWRTPLICGFSAGWARFMLCNVHIQWGESELSRKEEIDHVAQFIRNRTEDPTAWARKLILLGDFNIEDANSDTYKMLWEAEYSSPLAHKDITTTVGTKKAQYDRIFIRQRVDGFEIMKGGTIEMFSVLFRDEEEDMYRPLMKTKSGSEAKNYKHWRSFQLSDHQPLWVEFRIDYADEYLEKIAKG